MQDCLSAGDEKTNGSAYIGGISADTEESAVINGAVGECQPYNVDKMIDKAFLLPPASSRTSYACITDDLASYSSPLEQQPVEKADVLDEQYQHVASELVADVDQLLVTTTEANECAADTIAQQKPASCSGETVSDLSSESFELSGAPSCSSSSFTGATRTYAAIAGAAAAAARCPESNWLPTLMSFANKAVACQSSGEPLRPLRQPPFVSSNNQSGKLDKNQSYRERKRQKESLKCRCNYCGDILTLHAIKQHIERHTGCETTLYCSKCNMSCGTREKLREHIRIVHLKDKPFRCDICNYRFSTRHNYDSHQKTQSHHLVALGKKEPTPQRLGKQEPPAKTIDERMQLRKFAPIADGPEYVVLPDDEQNAASLYHAQKKSSRCSAKKSQLGEDESLVSEPLATKSVGLAVEIFRENFCPQCSVFCGSRPTYDDHMRTVHGYKMQDSAAASRNKRTRNQKDSNDSLGSQPANASIVPGAATAPQMTFWQKIDVNCMVHDDWRAEDTMLTVYQQPLEASVDSGGNTTTLVQQLHKLENLFATSNGPAPDHDNIIVENKSVLNAKACPGLCKLEEFVKVQARHIIDLEKQLRALRSQSVSQERQSNQQQSQISFSEAGKSNNNILVNSMQNMSAVPPIAAVRFAAMQTANRQIPHATLSHHGNNISSVVTSSQLMPISTPQQLPYLSPRAGNFLSDSDMTNAAFMPLNGYAPNQGTYSVQHHSAQNGAGRVLQQQQMPLVTAAAELTAKELHSVASGACQHIVAGGDALHNNNLHAGQHQQLLDPAYLSRLLEDYGWRTHHVIVDDDDDEEKDD